MAMRDEAVSCGTCLFPEPSDNVSSVGYCGNGIKYYIVTSSTISYACVHSQTDRKPPVEGERGRQAVRFPLQDVYYHSLPF